MGRYYKEFSDFLAEHFPGRKMQKLTIDAGFSCPNRDGTLSRGGCAYCNNNSFSPGSQDGRVIRPIAEQIEAGKQFFRRKYPEMRYLAYFQSYTNTHGNQADLLRLYDEALACEGVDGLIIGTRPDCLPQSLLCELARRHRSGQWITIELGAESSHDVTLERVNRCHTWQQTVRTVERIRQAGIPVGLHLIMGLPGEDRSMMLQTVERAALLHPDTIKFHQLQIIEGSTMAREWKAGQRFELFTPDTYLPLCCDIVRLMNRLSPATAIERFTSQAPASLLIAPRWGLKNYQFVNLLHNRLAHHPQ
jgi:hypothetical protein